MFKKYLALPLIIITALITESVSYAQDNNSDKLRVEAEAMKAELQNLELEHIENFINDPDISDKKKIQVIKAMNKLMKQAVPHSTKKKGDKEK